MGNHDNMLFSMLKECKTLPRFLDEIFGFLKRRTDFYHIQTDPNSPVGLPEGLAERVVRHTYFKWKIDNENIVSGEDIPIALEETVCNDHVEEIVCQQPMENLDINEVKTDQDKSVTFTTSESYNGATYENYSWSQNIVDIDISLEIPENVAAKDLKVNILPNSISVKLKSGTVLLEGELCQKCKNTDAIWSVTNKKLEIHLDKCLDMWWNCLIKSEPKLDISKIDCSRPFEDLPEEAQAKIEELQWNQERKVMGLPTSDELLMHEKLKKAWNAEGSPFKGPFDPSQVKFN